MNLTHIIPKTKNRTGENVLNEFQEYCQEQLLLLDKVIDRCNNCLKNSPEGTLRVSKNKNNYQFYQRTDVKDTCGKYLKKSENELASQLAQKDYAQKMLKVAQQKKMEMKQYGMTYSWEEVENVYKNMSLPRQKLIVPFVLSAEEYACKWEQQNRDLLQQIKKNEEKSYKRNVNKFELTTENGILTEKGDLVRSKSEKIIADKLYMMGIPYVYELSLHFQGNRKILPDFTVLNKRTRQVIYWEHFGMMDDPEYCEKAIKKIELYEKNGIFLGRQLIVTYETLGHSLNIMGLEAKIHEYLQ